MTKETILTKSLIAHALDEDELINLIKTSCTDLDDPADLPTAAAEHVGQAYMIKGVHYRCEDKGSSVYEWEPYDTSGQNLNYADASNKPTLDGVTINGAMTKANLGISPDTAERTAEKNPSGKFILLDDDKKMDYDDIESLLYANLEIATLPKYEKQNNPLLTSDGTTAPWEITHTCKTQHPIVQVFTSGGILVKNLALLQHSGSRVSIQITSVSNIAANTYYVVLIG